MKYSLNITFAALITFSLPGFAEIGIRTSLTCVNPAVKVGPNLVEVKMEVQEIPSVDEPKLPKMKFIGLEVGGSARPSSFVQKEKEEAAGVAYTGDTAALVILSGSGPQRKAKGEARLGTGSSTTKFDLVCHAPFQSFCGKALVDTSSGTPVWSLAIPNPTFPPKDFPKLVENFQLTGAANLKKDRIYCVTGNLTNPTTISVSTVYEGEQLN